MSELLEKARSFDPSKMEPSKTTWAPLQENVQINEDGHTDVASAVRQCKTTIEDAQDILQKLQTMNPEDSLPSWWTNKLAVVSSSINKMRDYLLVPSVSEEVELDEKKTVTKTFGVEFQIDAPEEKPIRTGNEPHVKLVNKLVKKYKLFDDHADDLSKFNVKDNVGGRNVQKFFKELSKSYDVIRKKITDNFTSTELDFSEEVELDEMKKVSVEFDKRNKSDMMKAKKDLEKLGHTVDVSGSMITITGKKGADIGREIKDVMNFYSGAKRAKALESVEEADEQMNPKDHVARSKNNPDMFCVFDTKGNEIKLFKDRKDAEEYAVKNHDSLMGETKEAVSPAQQAAIAISKKERGEKPKKEEVKLDEAIKISHVLIDTADRNEVVSMASSEAQIKQSKNSAERPPMSIKNKNTLKIVKLKRPLGMKAADKLFGYPFKESAELDEAKSSTGYELYHKSFSDAMQHSYAFAKKKFGITVDPKEIDRKVATGPKKPSSGKTNSYRLVGTDGKKAIQVQVANLDNKRYELNMYKEEVNLEEETELDTMKAYASGISRILGSQGIEVPINELIDPADVDDDASSKDVALAAKNIILQLKKSVDMNGKKDVEFASGKQKVPAAIAQKALDVHSKMKPQDKMKFQTTIAKSYTGLLNAIKGK